MTPEGVVRAIVGLLLDLLPHEEAKLYLDEEARKRADLAADALEAVKFSEG